jgi:arylsulfatase A-like enzyme
VLLPQVLGKAGYHTSIIGKWHLGLEAPNIPTRRGFNEFRGWLGDMMDDYYKQRRHGHNYMRDGEKVVDTSGTHATELFTQWSIESLRARAKAKQPFFQYLAYNAPHTPIQPPREWLQKVRQRHPNMDGKRGRLVALIEHLDDGIGRVLKELETLGLAENTLVIFTSDNGGQLGVGANNGPYRSGKCHVYEGGVRVAMCARWPGHIPAGRTSDFQAMTMDLFPTIAEVAGAKFAHHIEGRSFLPVLTGAEREPFGRVDVYRWLESTHKEALRQGDWKLVRDLPGAPFELYNIAEDPGEKHDLAEREPERLAALTELMREHLGAAEIVPWRRPAK